MTDLLDTVREEIDARLEELRPLAREASGLQHAIEALNGVPAAATADGRGQRRSSGKGALSRRSRPTRGDVKARVVEYVTASPGSTAGDVASALGLKRNSVATRMAQLAKSGVLVKAQRGYSAP
jgi:hypothetical protein